ncbi:MAG: hypothetical protein WAX89_02140, partial [Alphaproteobacteria bacterium]
MLLLATFVAGFGVLAVPSVSVAQEKFVTQSGGRGLQNARSNARMSKTEEEVKVIQADLLDIEVFARQTMAECKDNGSKLTWGGSAWTCSQETDPTVQDFAKAALPNCAEGTTLTARNGRFDCAADDGVLTEKDPTVMDFAKTPLPACPTGQVLRTSGTSFECTADNGLTVEIDPTVKPFAKDTLPTCGTLEVLKSNGSNLFCTTDSRGITEEVDPSVYAIARSDSSGTAITACGANNVLT